MNFATVTFLYFGSGSTLRVGTSLRLGISNTDNYLSVYSFICGKPNEQSQRLACKSISVTAWLIPLAQFRAFTSNQDLVSQPSRCSLQTRFKQAPNRLQTCGPNQDLGFFAPYFERPCRRSETPEVSNAPRTVWYRTPGKSFTLPPRNKITECSCRLCPSPPIYVVTSYPLVRRTRATFLSAEFGFLGVVV